MGNDDITFSGIEGAEQQMVDSSNAAPVCCAGRYCDQPALPDSKWCLDHYWLFVGFAEEIGLMKSPELPEISDTLDSSSG